jgi:uncharacterized membrane protein YdjX (TVP38/TMEM64 family)
MLIRHRRLLTVAAFLSLLWIGLEVSGLAVHFELATLREQVLAHQGGGLVLFVALFMLGNLLQVPGWVFLAAAVLTLGKFWGGAVTYLAASLACLSTFLVIRWIGGDALRQFKHPLATRFFAEMDAHPVRSVFFLRLIFQTVPALNYGLAMSALGLRPYVVGTLLGLPLPIVAYCLFFDALAMLVGLN